MNKNRRDPHLYHWQPLIMHALHHLALHAVVRRPQLLLPVIRVLQCNHNNARPQHSSSTRQASNLSNHRALSRCKTRQEIESRYILVSCIHRATSRRSERTRAHIYTLCKTNNAWRIATPVYTISDLLFPLLASRAKHHQNG